MTYLEHNARAQTSVELRTRAHLDNSYATFKGRINAERRDTTMSKDWIRLRRDQAALMHELAAQWSFRNPERTLHAMSERVRAGIKQVRS